MRVISSGIKRSKYICRKGVTEAGLNINLAKTTIVPFTKRYKIDGLKQPKMDGVHFAYSYKVKYLGVTLDKILIFNAHLKNVLKKPRVALGVCVMRMPSAYKIKLEASNS